MTDVFFFNIKNYQQLFDMISSVSKFFVSKLTTQILKTLFMLYN